MKLHLGCGPNIKEGYVNVDAYVDHPDVEKHDLLDMPYPDASADEILSEHVFEHIGFKDEERLWKECFRVLKPGGKMIIETPDMEWLCQQFVEAQDQFTDWYTIGAKDHYFGNGRSIEHRWGMITTHFFGNQNGDGQFHKNGYTKQKFIRIGDMLGFSSVEVMKIFNKGAQAIVATFIK